MSTLLGPDGRFAFSGVPEGAELRFVRDDGIDARMSVPVAAASLTVELTGNTAKAGRRRAAPSTPGVEIEGLVKTVAPDSLVVTTERSGDVTVKLDANTAVRQGNRALTVADLKPGNRVHVKVLVAGDVKTATLVVVQDQGADDGAGHDAGDDHPNNGGAAATASGTVKSVGSSSLVVTTQAKGDVTVQVDANTVVKRKGQRISLSDLKAGDAVKAFGTAVDDHTIKAREIEVEDHDGNDDHGGHGNGGDD